MQQVIPILLLLLACAIFTVNGLNILGIFELPSKSVHILGHELLVGLARRGYNVTLISSFPVEQKIQNYSHVYLDGTVEFKEKNFGHMIQGQSKLGALSLINGQSKLVDMILHSKTMEEFLKSDNKYDIIIQTYAFNEAYLALAHHFDARVIGFVPFSTLPHILSLTGNSAPYSYVPLPFLGYTDDMTFLQRTMNVILGHFISLVHSLYLYPKQEAILRSRFPDFPPIEQIEEDRVDLIFSNVHFSNESPRPKTPNIVHIGGYHVQEPEPLTPDVQKILDNSSEGVVFLAFGTNIDTAKLPQERIDAFIHTFSKIPYKVLLKFDGVLRNKPNNVETVAWLPQKGVLAHPNTKIFISHGGKGSATESLYYGVPVLCVSFYGDQKKNCEDISDYDYGVHLPYEEVTKETFKEAFDELNTNPK
ncbi:putative glucuronosyltransferase [Trypoxylus dichotomus]